MNRFALACGVALLMNCNPNYQSGSTECSPSGTCPNGFVCGDASNANAPSVCYEIGKTTCPSAPAYYCPASASCWASQVACDTVVNCADGPAACVTEGHIPDCSKPSGSRCGSAGAGGSGGGAGGSGGGAGGTGGTGGTDWCIVAASDTACTICVESRTHCCEQFNTCLNMASCSNLLTCVGKCSSGDTTCVNNCTSSYPSGVTPLINLSTCEQTYCSSICSS
jgi:hypothetical protein